MNMYIKIVSVCVTFEEKNKLGIPKYHYIYKDVGFSYNNHNQIGFTYYSYINTNDRGFLFYDTIFIHICSL